MKSLLNLNSNKNPTDATRSQPVYQWVMLGGVWLAYFSFGVVQGGIPPLVTPVSQDLGLSRSAMGTVLGAWPFIYIIVAIPAGALIDRFNLRLTIASGVTLIALSGFLRSIAVDYPTMLIAVMVFGIGGPFISIGAPKLISTWFDKNQRGRAMGIYLTAPALGRILVLSTSNSILMPILQYSWRWTLSVFSGVALATAILWLIIAKEHPSNSSHEKSKDLLGSMKVFPELLNISLIKITLLIVLGMFLFNHGTNNWMPAILTDKGISLSRAGTLAAIPVAMGAIGAVAVPQIVKASSRRKFLILGFLITASTSVFLVLLDSGPLLWMNLALQGVASRGIMPIIMLLLIDAAGSQKTGAAGGLYFTSGEIGGVLGPVLLGISSDLLGGFNTGLLVLSAMCVLLGLGSIALRNTAEQALTKKD